MSRADRTQRVRRFPQHHGQAANGKKNQAEHHHGNPVPAIQYAVETMFGQIRRIPGHQLGVVMVARSKKDPAHVRPDGSIMCRRGFNWRSWA